MSKKGMRAGIKGRNVTSRQKDRIMRRLQLLGPDDKYTPQAVRDQIDYLTGMLKGKGAAGREGYKEGGSVKKNLKEVPEGNKGLKKLPTEVRNKMGFMKKGGIVKGGTSSQMTGKEFKGIF